MKTLHMTVAKLRQRELELQLKVKEQSILLHEHEPSGTSLLQCSDVLIKMCCLADISSDDLLDKPDSVSNWSINWNLSFASSTSFAVLSNINVWKRNDIVLLFSSTGDVSWEIGLMLLKVVRTTGQFDPKDFWVGTKQEKIWWVACMRHNIGEGKPPLEGEFPCCWSTLWPMETASKH